MDLKEKVIAITGAGRGLGRAMALQFAARGARLALIDTGAEALDEAVALCAGAGIEARGYVANVADEAVVTRTFANIVADFGALNGLVNNAGITRDGLFIKAKAGKVVARMELDAWQQVIDVNLTGTFLCGREAAAQMIESGSEGVIINISSIARAGNMGQTNYSATKAGVEAMAVAWSRELARFGIRAASIAPGFVGTEMVLSMKPEAREKIAAMIPAARLGTPDEIASTALFIFENDYVNGRCIEIDGGLRI